MPMTLDDFMNDDRSSAIPLDEFINDAPEGAVSSKPKTNIIDYYTGGKENIPPENWVARGLYQTGKDIATIPYHAVNQALLNYPRRMTEQAGFEYPARTESGAGQVAANVSGIAGAIESPVVKGVAAISKVPSVAKALSKVPTLIKASAAGAAYGGAYAPEDGGNRAVNAAVGAAIPVGLRGVEKGVQAAGMALKDAPGRVINSLIKPLLKDFSYGKNPGAGVAKEGIVANNFDDLIHKISERKDAIGGAIEETLYPESVKKINLTMAFRPLDSAINEAGFAPKSNSAVLNRLKELKSDLLNIYNANGDVIGTKNLKDLTPLEAWELKKNIGKLTKWTGNPSDDKIVNKSLKRVYGNIKGEIEKAVPAVSNLNERYANMLSAENAAVYREKIDARHNMLGLGDKLILGGTGVSYAALHNPTTLLAGIGAYGVNKILSSTAAKTRIAKTLQSMSEADQNVIFKAYPKIKQWFMTQVNKPYLNPREPKAIEVNPEILQNQIPGMRTGLPDMTGRGMIPASPYMPIDRPKLPAPQLRLPMNEPVPFIPYSPAGPNSFRMIQGGPVQQPSMLLQAGYPDPSLRLPAMRQGIQNPSVDINNSPEAKYYLQRLWEMMQQNYQ